MRIIFIENSFNFTASSLNLKALDSLQKILINFAIELSKNNHDVIFYNQTLNEIIEQGVSWKPLKNLEYDQADILIAVQELELLDYKIKAELKFLLLHYKPDNHFNKEVLIKILQAKTYYLINIT